MANKQKPDAQNKAGLSDNIRRGKGMRLSVGSDVAGANEATSPGVRLDQPARRGKGMRLSVNAESAVEASTPANMQSVPDEPRSDGSALRSSTLQQIDLPQGKIAYRQAGSGPALLLIHGWGVSSRVWLGTLEHFSDVRCCYALDMPGFGASPPLHDTPSIGAMADVVLAFADALGLDQFDLSGLSLGAVIATHLAAQHPERVRSLMLTAFGVRHMATERLPAWLNQRSLNYTVGLWRPWINLWQPWTKLVMQSPPFVQTVSAWLLSHAPSDADQWREIVAEMASADPRTYLSYVDSTSDPAVVEKLRDVRALTLLLAGRGDRFTPSAEVTTAQSHLPNSQLVTIDACGHFPMLEQPDAYHEALRAFLLS